MDNLLIKAENIKGLKFLINERKLKNRIDLIYIDPPFATNSNFTYSSDRTSTVSNSKSDKLAYSDKLTGSAFLSFLKQRLVLLRNLLSEEGSLYLHIDYKIGHYVKILMDEIFGLENFRNDITRIKCNPKNFKRTGYGNVKDMILFYSKGKKPIWNEPYEEYTEEDKIKLFSKTDEFGRKYTTVPIHAPGETQNGNSNKPFKGMLPPKGRHWRTNPEIMEKWDENGLIEWSSRGNPRKKIYIQDRKGKRIQDIWELKDPQYPVYPTEKNFKLLDRIIKTSSNENSIVLDCFCGSGTTLKAANLNNRRWIGIDQSDIAIQISKEKIENNENTLFQNNSVYEYIEL
jgi:adenine-specific DNA-methyltransferase